MRMADPQVQMGEDCLGTALFNKTEAVSPKLLPGVEHHQIIGLEQAAHVVNADGDEPFGRDQLAQRCPAAADYDALTLMVAAKALEIPGQVAWL